MADGGAQPMRPACPKGARWTFEEVQLLKLHYPKGGLEAARKALPHRSDNSIYMAATKFKLRSPRIKKTSGRRLWPHVPELDDEIRAAANAGGVRCAWKRVADRWGYPLWYVQKRAHALGAVLPHVKGTHWTEEEVELLHKTAHVSAGRAAAIFRKKGFHRTETAIHTKRHHMNVERSDNGVYTERGLAQILGCSHNRIRAAINNGELRATRERKNDPHAMKHITEKALRDWLSTCPYAIELRNVPPASQALLITALTGR